MEPIFDPTTERVYEQLPYHYRTRDAQVDYQLKRYISGLVKNQDDVNTLIDRLTYTPLDDGGEPGSTSDLVDPLTADLDWLPWLGQLFGSQIKGAVTEETRREIINASGFRAGTTDSVVAAAQKVLVGSKKVRVIKHADDSWQPDMNETIYRTNLASRPNFANIGSIVAGGGATLAVDTSWWQFGSGSLSITTAGGNNASAAYIGSGDSNNSNYINFRPGETYVVSGYMHLPAVHTATGAHALARTIIVGYTTAAGGGATSWKVSTPAPNAIGTTRLSISFKVPDDAITVSVRAFNGSATNGDKIQFDGFLVEKTDSLKSFFDGNTATDAYSYRWTGAPNASPSQQYIPAAENTAGPWDMLIMTLQSETLKNLLQPSLSQSMSSAIWDCDYESFGYDPNYVLKRLVEQEGVYQNRAFSFNLRDTEWQASVQSTTGFGSGPFGQGPFGLGTDITSKLRLLSTSGFNVTPGDSYQYLVDIGLQQDISDEKRSAIGFQFYDESGDVLNKVESANLYPDPSHEYGTGWFNLTAGSNSTVSLDTARKHTGTQSYKIATTAAGTAYKASTATVALSTLGTFAIGDQITLSAWIYVPTGVTISGSWFYASGTGITTQSKGGQPPRDSWYQQTMTTTVTNPTGNITLRLYGGTVAGNEVWWDDISVAKGAEAADFNGDTPDPVVGSYDYVWSGTPGASTTYKMNDVYSTPITVTPNIVNNAVVSHNFVKSTKSRNYAAYANDVMSLNVNNYGKYENGNIIRTQVNNVVPTTELGLYATPNQGFGVIPQSTLFTYSVDVNISANANANQLRVFFRDDANGDNEAASFRSNTPAVVSFPTKGRWHRYTWTATVNPGRTITSAYIVVEGTSNQPVGATLDTANWLIEEGGVSNPYFNGSSPDYNEYRFVWDGVEEASVSNKVLISVAEANKVDMEQFTTRFTAPPGSSTAKVFVDMDGFNGKDTLLVAQNGVREEYDSTWVPETADPVASIIRNGAKPAGVILHYKPIVANWDTITAEGTRPWDELQGLSWVEVEELT